MSISAQGFARLRKLSLFRVRLDELWIEDENPCLFDASESDK